MKKFITKYWPPLSMLTLIVLRIIFEKFATQFIDTLVATLIGVFSAFWLNYLFLNNLRKKEEKGKCTRLLSFLKVEIHSNNQSFTWIDGLIKKAIDLNVLLEQTVTKSIKKMINSLKSNSYHAMQACGWFEFLKNNELASKIITTYQRINELQGKINFIGLTFTKFAKSNEDKKKAEWAYKEIIKRCQKLTELSEDTISLIDKELEKTKSAVTITRDKKK